MSQRSIYRIALLHWTEPDGISEMISDELTALGHHIAYFKYGDSIPKPVDVVFSHGPHGELLPLWKSIAKASSEVLPVVVHWNTEGLPDLRLPSAFIWGVGASRSKLSQLKYNQYSLFRRLARIPPIAFVDRKMHRFRCVGDYDVAYRQGLLHVLADSSKIYRRIFTQHGIPTIYVPWGPSPSVYANLDLERDIDVLWMGVRGTRRRSSLLDRIRRQLRAYGIEIYLADNEENPFIFGETRTKFLNRAKITLNITRTWYDDNFSRFAFAISNRSLVISEPLLLHCPEYKPNIHYVSVPPDRLAESIVHYLTHEDKRQRIVENAYRLVTTELTFRESIARLMDGVNKYKRLNSQAFATGCPGR